MLMLQRCNSCKFEASQCRDHQSLLFVNEDFWDTTILLRGEQAPDHGTALAAKGMEGWKSCSD